MGTSVDPQPTTRQFTCKNWPKFDDIVSRRGFKAVPRVSVLDPNFLKQIEQHEANGVPLVVQDFHKLRSWKSDIFNPNWLASHGQQEISVRNVRSGEDKVMRMSEFIRVSRAMPVFAEPDEKERFYGKDAPCPPEWNQYLHCGAIPRRFLPESQFNLMNNLPEPKRVETLMCYIGVSDTFTAIHKDLCGSFGHNLMCYTEHDGSSLWLMTESSSARQLTDHFLTMRQILDHETHVLTLEDAAEAAKTANVTMYVLEQRLGDLVLVPPRSCHQVVNRGGITMKTSWSRMTLSGLCTALYYELPLYRRVCRPETYRVKATIYYTLRRWTNELREQNNNNLAKYLATLSTLYDFILKAEYCSQHQTIDTIKNSGTTADPDLHCDFCGADIFQSFFYCKGCVQEQTEDIEDSFILCPGCYVEGRTCKCGSLKPGQLRPFSDLLSTRRAGHAALRKFWSENKAMKSIPLTSEREFLESSSKSGMFAVCMMLAKNRKTNKSSLIKRCSPPSEPSHDDFSPDARFHCKECHRTSCFKHFLSIYNLHSMHAVRAHHEGSLHAKHIEMKKKHQEKAAVYVKQEIKGLMPDEEYQLSDLAQLYDVCKPLHPLFCQPGWYDNHITIIRDYDDPSQASTGDYNVAQSGVQVTVPAERPKKQKRKALVLDCVLITLPVPFDNTTVKVSQAAVAPKHFGTNTGDAVSSKRHGRRLKAPSQMKADTETEKSRKRQRMDLDHSTSSDGPSFSFNTELARLIDSSARDSATPQTAGPSSDKVNTGKKRGKSSSRGTSTASQTTSLPSMSSAPMRLPGPSKTIRTSLTYNIEESGHNPSTSVSIQPQPLSELEELKRAFHDLKQEFAELKRQTTPVVVYVRSPNQVSTFAASSSHMDHESLAEASPHPKAYRKHIRQSPSESEHMESTTSGTSAGQDLLQLAGPSASHQRQHSSRRRDSSRRLQATGRYGPGSRVRMDTVKYEGGRDPLQPEGTTDSRPKFGQTRASTRPSRTPPELDGYETDELTIQRDRNIPRHTSK